ncbi:MAG: low molecular weight phosphotyrosine protein phosphatase [Proteobacteria bacterium]|nr:low molecular weight phosphotyrosine protein phosphatase [Pseudomonadota bacterium]
MKKILFVCTGNICRSPTAQAIARHKAQQLKLADKFSFDSAGTQGFHSGDLPDTRSMQVAKQRGISFDGIFSRRISATDFQEFDLLMCMDRSHQAHLLQISKPIYHDKIKLFLEFCQAKNPWNDEVIDPYYKGNQSFDMVFDVIDSALENLFRKPI